MIKEVSKELKSANIGDTTKNKFNNKIVRGEYCKTQNAITLIALVITIIVLLILAGVSISLLFGQNGILNNAEGATNKYQIQAIEEKLKLAKTTVQVENKGKVNLENYLEELIKEGIIDQTDIKDTEDENTKKIIVDGKYEFEIKEENENVEIKYTGKTEGNGGSVSEPKEITQLNLEKTNIGIARGGTTTLKVTIEPDDATNKKLNWTSSNTEVATVNNGTITAIGEGTTTITAQTTDGSQISTTCEIKVSSDLATIVKPGDYIKYIVPTKTFTMTTQQTGCDTDQTFNTNDYTGLWQILYNDNEHGLQIISAGDVTNDKKLQLGTEENVEAGKRAYNNSVTTLNTFCSNYVNTTYATSGRCVGSNPSNPSGTTQLANVSVPDYGNSEFKNSVRELVTNVVKEDEDYITDLTAMGGKPSARPEYQEFELPISSPFWKNDNYWLASRRIVLGDSSSITALIAVRRIVSWFTNDTGLCLCDYIDTNKKLVSRKQANGVRAVITLRSGIKTNEGIGSYKEPFELYI